MGKPVNIASIISKTKGNAARIVVALLFTVSILCLPGCASHPEEVVKSGPDAPRHPPGVSADQVNPPGNGPDTAAPKK